MKLSFLFFLKTALLLLPTLLTAQTVKLTADCPEKVNVGQEFLVAVNIEKENISGTVKMQFELPAGFSAKKVNGRGSDFEVANSLAKFSWDVVPQDNEFTISFYLTADETVFGKQIIHGEFVYSTEDRTEHVAMLPLNVTVSEPGQLQASAPAPVTPIVDRKITSVAGKKGEYKVELTFYPNKVDEPAQFTDILPQEYSALVIDAHEASYSFENQSVIFSWVKFPKEKSFTVSYLVRSNSTETTPVINGTLVYGDAAEITPKTVTSITPVKENNSISSPVIKEPVVAPQPKEQIAEASTTNDIAKAAVNSSVNNIFYRVQISATKKSSAKDSAWFLKKYKVNESVEMTMDEGWKKYLVGSFAAYDDATKFQSQTREHVGDAFIVAYQNGKRISLSEAIRNKPINQ